MRYQKKHDFPFGILDVADILRLNIRRRLPDQVYADCPFCSDRRGKMNLNLEKDTWRCNYCGRGGGMLGLYAVLNGVDKSQAYHDICDVLAIDGFEPYIFRTSVNAVTDRCTPETPSRGPGPL